MLQKSVSLLIVASCQIDIKKHSLLVELCKPGVAIPPSPIGKEDINIEHLLMPHTLWQELPLHFNFFFFPKESIAGIISCLVSIEYLIWTKNSFSGPPFPHVWKNGVDRWYAKSPGFSPVIVIRSSLLFQLTQLCTPG